MRYLIVTCILIGVAVAAKAQTTFGANLPCGQTGAIYVNESPAQIVMMQASNGCIGGNLTINIYGVVFGGGIGKVKSYVVSPNHSLAIRRQIDLGGSIEIQSAGTGGLDCIYTLKLP